MLRRMLERRSAAKEWGAFRSRVAEETLRLDAALSERSRAEPPIFDGVGASGAVWTIQMLNGASVRMRIVDATVRRYVVHVDGEHFYRHWLNRASPVNHPERTDQAILRVDMRQDYKFERAETGFTRRPTPVPLADVFATHAEDGRLLIHFNDGITRTIWLIANWSASFPVALQSQEDAMRLHAIAGVGQGPLWAPDLF